MNNQTIALYVIWGALLISCLVYGVVIYFTGNFNLEPITFDMLTIVFLVLGLIMPWIGIFLKKRFLKQNGDIFTSSIVCWAMIEAAVVYGLVSAFVSKNATLYVFLTVYAVILMIKERPALDSSES